MIERYTLPEMGKIWEDEFKFSTWLKIEILACEACAKLGEISEKDVDVIKEKAKFDVKRILEIEETTKHDVIAFLTNVAEYVGSESRHIHYGMTSSDILDTTLSYQMKTAGELLLKRLYKIKDVLKIKAIEHKNTICVGRSHGIHAEPTTMGLKFALWYEEIKRDIIRLNEAV
jgi:adenylosuccinate lyase